MAMKLDTIQLQEGIQVPHVNILMDLLIIRRRSVLFVGEGDFSFTVAFAALRELEYNSSHDFNPGTWEGIVATHYESIPKLTFSEVVNTCKEYCENYHMAHPRSTESLKKIKMLDNLEESLPPPESFRMYSIDACHFKNHREELKDAKKDVIWFQCPWSGDNTYSLIRYFLGSASHILQPGDHVCVGISKDKDYVDKYNLAELTQRNSEDDILKRYEFRGVDDKLIKSVLEFGYHHQSTKKDTDIHDKIWDDHVTLIFCRKKELETCP